jgi:hypothetical protein
MEPTCSSQTSTDFQWITRRYIPEDINNSSNYEQIEFMEFLLPFSSEYFVFLSTIYKVKD